MSLHSSACRLVSCAPIVKVASGDVPLRASRKVGCMVDFGIIRSSSSSVDVCEGARSGVENIAVLIGYGRRGVRKRGGDIIAVLNQNDE